MEHLEDKIVDILKTIFDPEIPVEGVVEIDMTLTSPNCPVAESLPKDVKEKVESVEGVTEAHVNIVFDPPWDKDMMSEEAKLELGFL
jgi:metal-sulfur cluster biosynthetic enzyme